MFGLGGTRIEGVNSVGILAALLAGVVCPAVRSCAGAARGPLPEPESNRYVIGRCGLAAAP